MGELAKKRTLTTSCSIGSSSIIFMFVSDSRPKWACEDRYTRRMPCHSPWDTSAYTFFAPLSTSERAASARVEPVSIMSSTKIATYKRTRHRVKVISAERAPEIRTLSRTSPTRTSIFSGPPGLRVRSRWINANSTPSLSAIAVTLRNYVSMTARGGICKQSKVEGNTTT